MKQSEITRKLEWFLDVKDRQVTLTILHEAGMVQKFEGVRTTKGSGRPATMWRATRGIVNDALGTVVRHKRFGS
jgi:predicted ArsR family transcriptional regulator